jgi:hypothetical protein
MANGAYFCQALVLGTPTIFNRLRAVLNVKALTLAGDGILRLCFDGFGACFHAHSIKQIALIEYTRFIASWTYVINVT